MNIKELFNRIEEHNRENDLICEISFSSASVKFQSFDIPEDLKKFYLTIESAVIFNSENIDGYSFISYQKLYDFNLKLKDVYQEDFDPQKIVFCELLGEGNFIAIDMENKIYDGFHEEAPVNWTVIETSLLDWLTKLLKNNGNKYWLKDC